MTSASESAAERLTTIQVGTQPIDKVLRDSGIRTTEAGKARWREALRQPIPEDALAEGRRRLADARAEAHGDAA